MKERVNFMGIDIDPWTMSETVSQVENYIDNKKPLHLMGVNADKINQCFDDVEMKAIVNSCGITNADGASVVLAAKYLGIDIPERVAGIDLMQELLKKSEEKGYTVYFLGAKEEVLQKMIENFKTDYPNLKVVGSRNGYFQKEELGTIGQDITNTGAQIVFVGITSPNKEYFIEHFLKEGVNSVFMGVGGSFDVLSGTISRAPMWMQNANLEWLYRVYKEPRRLFKRYFVGNVTFIKRVLKEKA